MRVFTAVTALRIPLSCRSGGRVAALFEEREQARQRGEQPAQGNDNRTRQELLEAQRRNRELDRLESPRL